MSDNDHMLELVAAVARMETKLDAIDKGVNGNGQPGLKQKVEDLEASKNRLWGMGVLGSTVLAIGEFVFHYFNWRGKGN